ncbi:MAG: hypothetical protein QF460_02170 [Candidatus Nanoarchaeia archaeon]|jgi:hypothetical protein|nr:hypothetical protein [Candidatus Nanoarchaeia archaeon]|tara:strand:- start:1281 stop:2183 length:903 start_codon:yes stop_codon:yes gene_type:complete
MDLVAPAWVSALRGIGVVCNIYNIAKASDDVIDDLEEKMGWRQKRRAKKEIKRHYNGRVAELNSECKDTIKMMRMGDQNWRELIDQPEPSMGFTVGDPDLSVGYSGVNRIISDEPDRSELIHDTAKGIQEMKIRIERHNKLLTKCESKILEYVGSNERVAKRYISEKVKLEKSREDHEIHLVTLDMCIGRMQIEGHDRERFDLTPVYENAAKVLKSMDVLLDYGAHRNALGALGEHESKLDLEREIDRTAIDSNIYDSEVDVLFEQYQLQNRAEDSARAVATKKSSDLENLVSKARAVGV